MSGVEIGGVQLASPENLSNELESISSELLTYHLKYLTFPSFSLSPLQLSWAMDDRPRRAPLHPCMHTSPLQTLHGCTCTKAGGFNSPEVLRIAAQYLCSPEGRW